jgi:hypothetical protein
MAMVGSAKISGTQARTRTSSHPHHIPHHTSAYSSAKSSYATYLIEYPPSTAIAAPVTKSDAALHRNTAVPASSCG